ncbi:hypothetical protein B296_00003896 [Ensete ventricosum]|uniref:Uncharacterized protein n=1 Tax=Ensete ventricosum TaxID=4639 RepID=A0A427AZA6_ENSVE|nr:hypothetical protein B296_00003896 [Ensete ventricosum]
MARSRRRFVCYGPRSGSHPPRVESFFLYSGERNYDGSRSSLGIGPGSDDAMGPCREFAKSSAKGIRNLTENTSGDHQKTHRKNVGGCRIDGKISMGKPSVSGNWTACTPETRRLPAVVSG